MTRTFFTADTHFGHASVIRMCGRPFATVDEMNREMIARWNAAVGPRDEIWHLGDFAYKMPVADARGIWDALNGRKSLIRGNHDKASVAEWGWESVHDLHEIAVDGRRVVLCHYPLAEWPAYFRDAIHLYGHVHGNRHVAGAVDVGVDCWDFRPVTLAEILARRTPPPIPPRQLEDWERAYIEQAKLEAERRALDEILGQRVDQSGGR
ncbi:metallophosphoesterase [Aurantimonas sp. 22II-16-19i]|uniref:metallophosphoesterase family protein n=1 Tax=Aurantimonas sp. 22II-16-19i TaxID=1317114 RepID=UPI0009F7DA63|nr:metallophosphoesterase [Aurantimonas sp. 22II-16-19i]ORE90760.1 phosphoesterase or phosphohydrolase [Aurantimonas sp. 22II-16-19i]